VVNYGLHNGADFVSKELTEFVAHSSTVISVKRGTVMVVVQQIICDAPPFPRITTGFQTFYANILASRFVDEFICGPAG